MKMIKSSRVLFCIAGVIMPILIGCLHTYVHFHDLMDSSIAASLQLEGVIMGEMQALWPTWGIVSFMMGLSFIVIGILNGSFWYKSDTVPYGVALAMILYYGGVIYVGLEFEQGAQLYGGAIGLFLIMISAGISLTLSKDK